MDVVAQELLLCIFTVFFHFALGSLEFHFIDQSKSYSEAKTYCRQRYTDLATVESLADMNTLLDLFLTTGDTAWIGLEIGNQFNWHWSRADENTDYFNWEKEETQTLNSEKCAAMSQNGSWLVSDCGDEKNFICHGKYSTVIAAFYTVCHNKKKKLLMIKQVLLCLQCFTFQLTAMPAATCLLLRPNPGGRLKVTAGACLLI